MLKKPASIATDGSDKPDPARKGLPVIGWREWVALPELGIHAIKVKVDTGARTSALHAANIHYFKRHGYTWVRFEVHPIQRDSKTVIHAEAPLLEERHITDSGGRRTLRPVVETTVELFNKKLVAEITLVARDEMGFRMLLGRQAIRGEFIVNPGRSYRAGHFKDKKIKKARKTKVKK